MRPRRSQHGGSDGFPIPPAVERLSVSDDFNGDGKADIAVATHNATTDDVTMLLGNGNRGRRGRPKTASRWKS